MPALLSILLFCAMSSRAQDHRSTVRPAQASSTADPLSILLTNWRTPPDEAAAKLSDSSRGGEGLARAQAALDLTAEGLEAFRGPGEFKKALAALPGGVHPALKEHFKNRDAALVSAYRTLAAIDFTWALRLKAACPAERQY